eukprot:1136791-Pelagomonas_calceolata.AAC.11
MSHRSVNHTKIKTCPQGSCCATSSSGTLLIDLFNYGDLNGCRAFHAPERPQATREPKECKQLICRGAQTVHTRHSSTRAERKTLTSLLKACAIY